MLNLKGNPFFLEDEDIAWVDETLSNMTDDEKLGQLFCLIGWRDDEDYLKSLAGKYKAGGLMCRPMPSAQVINSVRVLQENSKIPMLIAANLESGGTGITTDGTKIGSLLQIAATDDDSMAYKLGVASSREGSSVGCNWAFAPIIDIDRNFRNPITNTRTLGSDPDRVRRMGVEYVKGVQENGVAASIKHFPGDGIDERDQHLVTSINSLSCEEWDSTFGAAYKAGIEAGALTCMIGHIMQPAYTKRFNPGIADADMLPATLSKELTTKLLREQLGFNGLIVTDASTMAGMIIPMSREKAVPLTIASGCDMFLFTKNIDEDYSYMKAGIEDGTISQERLKEALTRILATKAALALHKKQKDGSLIPCEQKAASVLRCAEHLAWAKECADKAITLVKEEKGVLPIKPDKYKKVLYYGIEAGQGIAYSVRAGVVDQFRQMLSDAGFEVDAFQPAQGLEGMARSAKEITDRYDLIVYMCNLATKSNQTTIRIEWQQPMGANVPVYMTSVPTIFISVENPYHLLDVPRGKRSILGRLVSSQNKSSL